MLKLKKALVPDPVDPDGPLPTVEIDGENYPNVIAMAADRENYPNWAAVSVAAGIPGKAKLFAYSIEPVLDPSLVIDDDVKFVAAAAAGIRWERIAVRAGLETVGEATDRYVKLTGNDPRTRKPARGRNFAEMREGVKPADDPTTAEYVKTVRATRKVLGNVGDAPVAATARETLDDAAKGEVKKPRRRARKTT